MDGRNASMIALLWRFWVTCAGVILLWDCMYGIVAPTLNTEAPARELSDILGFLALCVPLRLWLEAERYWRHDRYERRNAKVREKIAQLALSEHWGPTASAYLVRVAEAS